MSGAKSFSTQAWLLQQGEACGEAQQQGKAAY
jgi:hypothetical protein